MTELIRILTEQMRRNAEQRYKDKDTKTEEYSFWENIKRYYENRYRQDENSKNEKRFLII